MPLCIVLHGVRGCRFCKKNDPLRGVEIAGVGISAAFSVNLRMHFLRYVPTSVARRAARSVAALAPPLREGVKDLTENPRFLIPNEPLSPSAAFLIARRDRYRVALKNLRHGTSIDLGASPSIYPNGYLNFNGVPSRNHTYKKKSLYIPFHLRWKLYGDLERKRTSSERGNEVVSGHVPDRGSSRSDEQNRLAAAAEEAKMRQSKCDKAPARESSQISSATLTSTRTDKAPITSEPANVDVFFFTRQPVCLLVQLV